MDDRDRVPPRYPPLQVIEPDPIMQERASPLGSAMVYVGATAIVVLVLYGLTRPEAPEQPGEVDQHEILPAVRGDVAGGGIRARRAGEPEHPVDPQDDRRGAAAQRHEMASAGPLSGGRAAEGGGARAGTKPRVSSGVMSCSVMRSSMAADGRSIRVGSSRSRSARGAALCRCGSVWTGNARTLSRRRWQRCGRRDGHASTRS